VRMYVIAYSRDDVVREENLLRVNHSHNVSACGRANTPGNERR
jgi:hypothetical protein